MNDKMISIIIPTKGREKQLLRCLDALVEQSVDNSLYEVAVVNDGSKYSQELVKKYKAKLPNFKYFEIKQSGPATARNIGAKSTKGNLIAFIDDDCVPNKDWLEKILVYFRDPEKSNIVAVGGSVKPLKANNNIVNEYLSFTKHLDGPIKVNGKITNMASANFIVPRQIFDAVGGFDQRFPYAGAEDQNLIWKLSKVCELHFCEEIQVLHDHDIGFKDFRNKYRRYGRGVALHLKVAKENTDETDMYIPYCNKKIELILYFNKIIMRAGTNLKRNASEKVGLLKFMRYWILAICQEFYFQLGSVDMNKDLEKGKIQLVK